MKSIETKVQLMGKKIAMAVKIFMILSVVVGTIGGLVLLLTVWPNGGILYLANLSVEVLGHAVSLNGMVWIVFVFFVELTLIEVIFLLVYRIFYDMGRGQTPFSATQAKRVRTIALVSLISYVEGVITTSVLGRALSIDFPSYINMSGHWITPLLLYCIALIFE